MMTFTSTTSVVINYVPHHNYRSQHKKEVEVGLVLPQNKYTTSNAYAYVGGSHGQVRDAHARKLISSDWMRVPGSISS